MSGFIARLMSVTTSSAVTAFPLENVAPSRSVKVQVLRSSELVHDSASSGLISGEPGS